MNRIECPGLDGSNPLHFLASLGVLQLLHRQNTGSRMAWVVADGCYHPVYSRGPDGLSMEDLCSELHVWISEMGRTRSPDKALERRARDLSARINKAEKTIKNEVKAFQTAQRALPKEDVRIAVRDHFGERQDQLQRDRFELAELQVQIADALGDGVAHVGDIIGVNPALFRAKAARMLNRLAAGGPDAGPAVDDPRLVTDAMAALACDQVSEGGKLAYTPYSFSNGGSGQCLLKDFRECANVTEQVHLRGTLEGEPRYVKKVGSLGWDPSDQALYAVQWAAPEVVNKRGKKDVDPAIQALGYVGLSLFPAVPEGEGLTGVGWSRTPEGRRILWPIWTCDLTLDVVKSLLSMDLTDSGVRLKGVAETFQCSVQNPNGKRNFFSPSRSI